MQLWIRSGILPTKKFKKSIKSEERIISELDSKRCMGRASRHQIQVRAEFPPIKCSFSSFSSLFKSHYYQSSTFIFLNSLFLLDYTGLCFICHCYRSYATRALFVVTGCIELYSVLFPFFTVLKPGNR